MNEKQITHSTPPEWTGVSYSSINPFNMDSTRLLLIKRDHYGLYDGSGNFITDLKIPASAEPIWSRFSPAKFYYIEGNTLMSALLSQDGRMASTVERVFPEYPDHSSDGRNGITGSGESDISWDGNNLVLANWDKSEIFVYKISSRTKSRVMKMNVPVDGMKITSNNKVIISTDTGIWLANPDSSMTQITRSNGHACVMRGLDGVDYLIWINSNDPAPLSDQCQNGIVSIRLTDLHEQCLVALDWSLAVHISPCSKGFMLVSTYGAAAKGPYANKVLKLGLDGKLDVICDTHSLTPDNRYYNAQPRAALNFDGTKFVFNSNNGVNPASEHYSDVYLGEIPDEIIIHQPDPDPPVIVEPQQMLQEVDLKPYDGMEFRLVVEDGMLKARLYKAK
jgi:hypothetical protein